MVRLFRVNVALLVHGDERRRDLLAHVKPKRVDFWGERDISMES